MVHRTKERLARAVSVLNVVEPMGVFDRAGAAVADQCGDDFDERAPLFVAAAITPGFDAPQNQSASGGPLEPSLRAGL